MHSFRFIKTKLLGLAFFCFCLITTGLYSSPSVQFSKIPLYFEKNMGQTDPSVKYLAKGHGYSFYFTPQEIVVVLKNPTSASAVLKLKFVSAKQDPSVVGIDEHACKSNYFIGNDPTKWQTDVSTFAKVQYEELYPGINAIFYGHNEQLEYDLCLAPQANPEMARLHVEGAQSLLINGSGDLCIRMEDGEEVQMKKPIVYQNLSNKKVSVEGNFVLFANNEVGFALGNYDKSANLVIDPVLVYSSYIGGSNEDSALGIAVDSAGNAYIAGNTSSTNFPTKNPFQSANAGVNNVFIAKFNPSLSGLPSLIYSTYLGGSNADFGASIAVDSTGKAYVAGTTYSTDFPTKNAFQTTNNGQNNVFVTALNSTGNELVYSSYLGGSNGDFGFGIALDSANNVYVTGATFSSDFPTKNAFQPSLAGIGGDAFITKIDSTPSIVYSSYLGGSIGDSGNGIAVDTAGNAYITGYTFSSDFPTVNAFQNTLEGLLNAFVAKIDSTPSIVYSSYLGGNGTDSGAGIAVDSAGNAYVTGNTTSTNFPTVHAFQTFLAGQTDAFVTKINSTPSIVYSSYLGGSGTDAGFGIAVDSADNALITGITQSTDFPTKHACQTTLTGTNDAFITKIDSTPSLVYSSYLGGSGGQSGNSIAVDAAGNAYITGDTSSLDFPTVNAYQNDNAGILDAFIVKISMIVFPPIDLEGFQRINKFATQKDIVNIIKWRAPSGGNTIAFFKIYRGKKLIAEVPNHNCLHFEDHNRKECKTYTYSVVSVDECGNSSCPTTVTIQP